MAAPTLQAQGATVAVTSGTVTAILPAHQADDILLAPAIYWGPNSLSPPVGDIGTPSGWTLIGSQQDIDGGSGSVGKLAWFWKRATSGAETNPTFARGGGWDTGTDTCFGARAFVIRGCITTGDPWDAASASGPHTAANQAFAAVTVSGSARMVVQFGCSTDDAAFAMTSSGWTTGTEDNDPAGTDCSFQTARKDNVSSSTSADTATVSAPVQGAYGFMGISFKPPGGAAQTISPSGIASTEAFGTARVNQQVRPIAIATAETVGTAKLNQQVRPIAIATAETVGTAKLNQQVRPIAIATAETVGTAKLNQQVRPAAIASAQAFGVATVQFSAQQQFPSRLVFGRVIVSSVDFEPLAAARLSAARIAAGEIAAAQIEKGEIVYA